MAVVRKAVVRRAFSSLTKAEKAGFIGAVKWMKSHDLDIGPNGTKSNDGGTYQKYIRWHMSLSEHGTVSFLAWHRIMLWEFEEDLIKADIQRGSEGNNGNIAIPYWEWSLHNGVPGAARGTLWDVEFMGGGGAPVTTGPFRDTEWKLYEDIKLGKTALHRDFNNQSRTTGMPNFIHILQCLTITSFDEPPFNRYIPKPQDITSFRNVLEGFAKFPGHPPVLVPSPGLHNNAHDWIGGHMTEVLVSPNDPVFYLNHGYVDLLWAVWQFMHPKLISQHPSDEEINNVGQVEGLPRKRGDNMTPWDGSNGTRIWTINDSLNHQTIGKKFSLHNYIYDYDFNTGPVTFI